MRSLVPLQVFIDAADMRRCLRQAFADGEPVEAPTRLTAAFGIDRSLREPTDCLDPISAQPRQVELNGRSTPGQAQCTGSPLRQSRRDPATRDLIGYELPHGTELRPRSPRRGTEVLRVEHGRIVRSDGQTFKSLSGAGGAITCTSTNGYAFLEYRLPDTSEWRSCDELGRHSTT